MKTKINPYLNFSGNCAEAMKFYQSIFGGNLEMQTYGEAGHSGSPEQKDRIMHAALNNEALSFMASDGSPDEKVIVGNNIHLSINGSDESKLTEYFNKLADGGTVKMSLKKQFWGDVFGIVTDKFGIHWMVNIGQENWSQGEVKNL